MKIEVFQRNEGMYSGPEVWVRVLSNEIVDWPQVRSQLSAEEHALIQFRIDRSTGEPMPPLSYHPHRVTEEERAEHGATFEDWWVFPGKKEA